MLTLTAPEIENYAQHRSGPLSPLLDELLAETHRTMRAPQMLTGPLEGAFLKLMVMLTRAKNVLEIGTFTGYSALAMAEGLPADGHLTTLDIEDAHIEVARKYFAKSEYGKKIELIKGDALASIDKLSGPFDLVFIDADKGNYKNYYEAVLPKMPSGGVILVDNVLWSGKVLNPKDEDDHAIVQFNEHVSNDSRVDRALLTIRDGVYVIRKK